MATWEAIRNIDAHSDAFCRFIRKLKAQFRDKPVHLVLDNDPIHKSRKPRVLPEKLQSWLK